MNAKTEQQIQRMKQQTIGVEIEMNHIPRERAARLAAAYFGTDRCEYTASRNGYSTWSAWDAQGREWKFQRDGSIAGCDAEKCELVTPILTYADIERLQELVRRLRKAGAISHAGVGAGVHIHIGASGHTPQTLRNLANIMASHERLLADALHLDQNRMRRYCRTVNPSFIEQLNRKKPTTMAQLADIWYTTNGAEYGRTHHYNDSRYHMTNYHAIFTKGTIEFRLFQFDKPANGKKNGLHAGQLKSYIQLCLALSEQAKQLRTANPKPPANRKPEIRHANMADSAGAGRRGVRHGKNVSDPKPGRRRCLSVRQNGVKGGVFMDAKQPAPTRRICPLCRNAYTEPPALSRTDSKTPICPDCGSRQALQALGVPETEIQQILRAIHQHKSLSAEDWSVRSSPKKGLDILSKLCYNKLEKKSCSGNTVTQKESPQRCDL